MAKKIKKTRKTEEKKVVAKDNKLEKKDKLKKEKIKKEKFKKEKIKVSRRILNFFKELKSELKKVVWPTKKNLFNSTMIVIAAIVFMAVFVVFADLLFHNFLKILLKTL